MVSLRISRMVSLNAAHGDVIGGVGSGPCIDTDIGKIYSGSFNRWIIHSLAKELYYEGVPYNLACPEQHDVAVEERINRLNTWFFVRNCLAITVNLTGDIDFIEILGNARSHSAKYGTFLQKELTYLEDMFPVMVADVNFFQEQHHAILDSVVCPSFIVNIGVKYDPRIALNEKFHEEVIISLRNAIQLCMKYDQDLVAKN